jgi:hypothetical protein
MIGVSSVQQMGDQEKGREATFCAAWNGKRKVREQMENNLQERMYHRKNPNINA